MLTSFHMDQVSSIGLGHTKRITKANLILRRKKLRWMCSIIGLRILYSRGLVDSTRNMSTKIIITLSLGVD